MIVLYTKKLQKYLEIPDAGISLPEFANPDALWHGNIFLHQRRNVLQLTHAISRFTIFIHGVTKKDLANFNEIVLEHLRYHMIKEYIPLQDMKYIDSISNEAFSFFKKPNKQITGTMNNMKQVYEQKCYTKETIDDKSFSHDINHMLFTIDGEYQEPVKAFKKYMSLNRSP